MATIPTSRRGRPRDIEPKVMLPVKVTAAQRKRFKMACAEEDATYGEMIMTLLDQRDARRERQRRAQAHPFHRPGPASIYPGGSDG